MNEPDGDDRAAVARTTIELLAGVNASDADRCVGVWAHDGVLMPPNHPAVHGQLAIGEYFRHLFSEARFRFTFTSSHIDLAGDTAVEYVTYAALVWRDDSPPVEDVGKGLHVYRRQPDGSWKLVRDIWNSNGSAR